MSNEIQTQVEEIFEESKSVIADVNNAKIDQYYKGEDNMLLSVVTENNNDSLVFSLTIFRNVLMRDLVFDYKIRLGEISIYNEKLCAESQSQAIDKFETLVKQGCRK